MKKNIWFIVAFLLLASIAISFAAPPVIDAGIDHRLPNGTGINPAAWRAAMTVFSQSEVTAAIATVAGDLSAHSDATTAVHGAAAGTRFLTASETLGIEHGGTGQVASTAALEALGGMKTDGSNGAATVALPGRLTVATGTAAEPAISFAGDSDTGIYSSAGGNCINFSTGGSSRLSLTTTLTTLNGHCARINATSTIQDIEITIASGASYELAPLFSLASAIKGTLQIDEYSQSTGANNAIGIMYVAGAGNTVAELFDPNGKFATATGTADSVNVISDGSGLYTIQNLLHTTTFILTYRGRK